MPDSYDLYATRTMIQAVEQMYAPESFLLDTFFTETQLFETEFVDVDFYVGGREAAGYVSPEQEGNVVTRIGFATENYKPPYIKEKMTIKPTDLLNRRYGATIYQAESPLQRAMRQMALDFAYLDDRCTRAEEVQASDALFTGQIRLLDGNTLVLPQKPTHQIDAVVYDWTDTDNSDPLEDLVEWALIVTTDSGVRPDTVIMGKDVIKAYINHPKVANNTAAMSSVKTDRGWISPLVKNKALVYYGYNSEIDCDIYTYNERYMPAGSPKGTAPVPMVPMNGLLMASTGMRAVRLYGPIMDLQAGRTESVPGAIGNLFPMRRFPKSWEEQDPSQRWLMLQTAPLIVPLQVDAYMFAYPVAAPTGQFN